MNELQELLEKLKFTLSEMDDQDSLEDIFEVEGVLLIIKDISDKIEFYKNLKKKRNNDIDDTIAHLDRKQDRLRSIIFNTIKTKSNKKTVNFPSVGKVSIKKTKTSWEIIDEKTLLDFLKQNNDIEGVAEIKTKVKKRELNEKLAYYKAQDIKVPGVEEVESKESLAIHLERDIDIDNIDFSVAEKKQSPAKSGIDDLQELVDLK